MKLNQVLQIIDLNALKAEFNRVWNKKPNTMIFTMQSIIAAHCDGVKISKNTANALLHRIEA